MVIDWLSIMYQGLLVTLQLVGYSALIATAVGAVLAVMFISPYRPLRWLAQLYVDIFRSIPLLALLFFFNYVLGKYTFALGLTPFALAVVCLALNEAAYVGEVYRAVIRSVPSTQWEAGTSLGMSWRKTLIYIVIPQALPPAVPGTLNMVIQLMKNSALASLISVNEVSLVASVLVSENFMPLEVFSVLALLYLAIIVPLTLMSDRLERFLAVRFGLSDKAVTALRVREAG